MIVNEFHKELWDTNFHHIHSDRTHKDYLAKNGFEKDENGDDIRGIYLYKVDIFGNAECLGFRSDWYACEVYKDNVDDLAKVVD